MCDDIAAGLLVSLDHLLQTRFALGGDDVIGQHHRKGLIVGDHAAGAPDRVTKAERLALADIGDGRTGAPSK